MGENSKIEWTDHTWNPWYGCTEVGPPCDNCYARVLMDERYHKVKWGAGEARVRTSAHNWNEPFRFDRAAAKAGKKATVFTLSLGDIWDNEVPDPWRHQAFDVMEKTPNLIYLLLSKRIGNAIKMCDPLRGNRPLPRNAALGATMADQEEWDRDIGKLLRAGEELEALFTFSSVEPMLGPIQTRGNLPDWVIVGGESGAKTRFMEPAWARDLLKQSRDGSAAFFMKQMTNKAPIPEDLLVRQFPRQMEKIAA